MDRSWIAKPKSSESYRNGIEEFLRFASQNAPVVGKVICPCNRCGNCVTLNRSTVRKHLLRHGFDHYYTRWIFHGELDLPAFSAEGSIELSERNDEDVNRGDDSKSTDEPGDSNGQSKYALNKDRLMLKLDEGHGQHKVILIADRYHQKNSTIAAMSPELTAEGSSEMTEKSDGDVNRDHSKSTKEPGDTTSRPKPTKDKGKATLEQDEGSNQKEISVSDSEEKHHQGPDVEKILTSKVSLHQFPGPLKMCAFAFILYSMRVKFGCDKKSIDYLIQYAKKLFPLFNSLPAYFNHVCDRMNRSQHMPTEYGSSSSNRAPILEQLDWNRRKCYACGQEMKPGASASTSSRRGKRNKRKPPMKKNAQ